MLRKMINRIIQWAAVEQPNYSMEEAQVPYPMPRIRSNKQSSLTIDHPGGMNFTVHTATGGKVIQFSTYDSIRDRSNNSLYVVTDKDDLGEELAQIITRESLTR
jgi:hypothetical protein